MRDILLTPIIIIRIAPSRKIENDAAQRSIHGNVERKKPEKIYEAQSKHANEAAVDMFVDRSREHARKQNRNTAYVALCTNHHNVHETSKRIQTIAT